YRCGRASPRRRQESAPSDRDTDAFLFARDSWNRREFSALPTVREIGLPTGLVASRLGRIQAWSHPGLAASRLGHIQAWPHRPDQSSRLGSAAISARPSSTERSVLWAGGLDDRRPARDLARHQALQCQLCAPGLVGQHTAELKQALARALIIERFV